MASRAETSSRTILVTGFGAFPGASNNPTAAIIKALGRHRVRLALLGVSLRCDMLPVEFARIDAEMRVLVAAHRPDVILHLGLASRRRCISIETRAINRAGPLHPDTSGRRPSQTIALRASPMLRATYPASRIRASLVRHRTKAALSIDAGDYVCNATLYRSLLETAASEVGFLHVPRTRTKARPLSRVGTAPPSIKDLTAAVLIAIIAMARPACR